VDRSCAVILRFVNDLVERPVINLIGWLIKEIM